MGPEDGITENLRNVYENAWKELDPGFSKRREGWPDEEFPKEIDEEEKDED